MVIMQGSIGVVVNLATVILVVFCADLSLCRPTEQPTKFTLSTIEKTTESSLVEPLLRLEQGKTLVTAAQANIASAISPKLSSSNSRVFDTDQATSVLNFQPVVSRETVRLENENAQGLLERPLSKTVGTGLENLLNPTPLVDRIREEEKYGNSGDKFIGIGRALVGGFEGFSNFLNVIIDIPRNAVKQKSRGITEALNQIGARIIGLQ